MDHWVPKDRSVWVRRSLAMRGYACLTATEPAATVVLHITADECERLAAELADVAAQLRAKAVAA